jgi:hypothetical protein
VSEDQAPSWGIAYNAVGYRPTSGAACWERVEISWPVRWPPGSRRVRPLLVVPKPTTAGYRACGPKSAGRVTCRASRAKRGCCRCRAPARRGRRARRARSGRSPQALPPPSPTPAGGNAPRHSLQGGSDLPAAFGEVGYHPLRAPAAGHPLTQRGRAPRCLSRSGRDLPGKTGGAEGQVPSGPLPGTTGSPSRSAGGAPSNAASSRSMTSRNATITNGTRSRGRLR